MKEQLALLNEKIKNLNYKFFNKPLIIGGLALQFYNVRKSGKTYSFIVSNNDYEKLSALYSNAKKDNWGDLSVVVDDLIFYRSINLLDYEYYNKDAIVQDDYLICSIDRLLLLCSIKLRNEQKRQDFDLLIEYIFDKFQNPTYVEYANKHLSSYYHSGSVYNDKYKKDSK